MSSDLTRFLQLKENASNDKEQLRKAVYVVYALIYLFYSTFMHPLLVLPSTLVVIMFTSQRIIANTIAKYYTKYVDPLAFRAYFTYKDYLKTFYFYY